MDRVHVPACVVPESCSDVGGTFSFQKANMGSDGEENAVVCTAMSGCKVRGEKFTGWIHMT